MLVVGAIGALAAVPLAHLFADGRQVVETYLTIGFALLPLSLIGGVTYSLMGGLGRWRLLIASRIIPFAVGLGGIVVLYAVGSLTVASSAIVTLAAGLLALIPAFSLRDAVRPLSVRIAIAREGVAFGLRTWTGGLASLVNARLDQLLMIRLVSPSELGFYAIAVTMASLATFLTGGLGPPLGQRVAAGERDLAPDAVRMTIAVVTLMGAGAAILTPFVIPLLFGDAFRDAIDMTLVLLAASIPLAAANVLGTVLVSDGAPNIPSLGEGAALLVTVPGLIVLLPSLGGLGAALVSAVAYSINLGLQVAMARRRLGGSWRAYLLPRPDDVRRVAGILRSR
jgi:O-antigen/teichoic acid export membrane protein